MTDAATASPDLDPLRSQISGKVVGAGDQDWDQARQAWNLAVDQHPAAVAFAASADDVAATVRFAGEQGLRVTAQATGHAAATHATLQDTVLLKTNDMADVKVDPEARTARVGAGTLSGDLAGRASEHGLAPLGGSSPDVGTVGYTLGGGLGWLGRRHGFASNSVRAMEVVTADGRVVRADADENSDLFWALRGGGGSFGIVTALELNLYPAAELFAGGVMFDAEHAPEVFRAYREWAGQGSEDVSSSVRFLTPPPIPDVPEPIRGRALVAVTAAHAGDPGEGERELAPLRDMAPLVMDMLGVVPGAALCRIHGDPEQPVPGIASDSTVLAELPDEAIDALVAVAGPDSGSPLLQVDLRHLGGALGRAPEGAGALAALDGEFAVTAVGALMGPVGREQITGHLAKLEAALAPWSTGGSYLNFADVPSDGSTAFSADTYAQLRAVKGRWDPHEVFRGGRDIPPAR